jgi:hypothetical protein
VNKKDLLFLADALEDIPVALKNAGVTQEYKYTSRFWLRERIGQFEGDAAGLYHVLRPESALRMEPDAYTPVHIPVYTTADGVFRHTSAMAQYFGLTASQAYDIFCTTCGPKDCAKIIREIALEG